VEALGALFAKKSTGASSNYGIGADGRVGLYVDEACRSWCSSSNANDQRAVTIECASDNKPPYPFRDVVYQKLIELCTDICRRNGKKRLMWFGDKNKTLSYIPEKDEMILTAHRWFAPKECPGNWMYLRMGDLAAEVTERLGGSAPVQGGDNVDNASKIWDFLLNKIGNPYGVAGLMGNLHAESGLVPTNLQNSFEKKLGMNDLQYTTAVDSGSYKNFINDGAGYGLAQWTFWTRKENLYKFKGSRSIGDLDMQLEYLWEELSQGYRAVTSVLKNAGSVYEASTMVLTQFERPKDQSENMKQKRAAYGQQFFDRFAKVPDKKMLVKINTDELNIRKGGGVNFEIIGTVKRGEVYTITQQVGDWGQLKSGAGWINLKYTVRI
jgi:hypothetical protein